ncbi:MAG: hypothetical protein ABG776_11715, partial [Cyanobacteria bacterium J06555_13]
SKLSAGMMQELRQSATEFTAARAKTARSRTTDAKIAPSKKASTRKGASQNQSTSRQTKANKAPYDFFASDELAKDKKRTNIGKKEQKSKVKCPNCNQLLNKIPSKSKKLKANHFLKCGDPACDTVMFWNANKKGYELPYAQRKADPASFTEHPCPSCSALLMRHPYKKKGKEKIMLRCSILDNRKGKCKEVAFFQSPRGGFWSPKFGVLQEPVKI